MDLFERERQRQAEDAKARQALKMQDKDRRRQILMRMAQRNQELTGEEAQKEEDEDLDCLDQEEEIALLGKRYKATLGEIQGESVQKKFYQVEKAPEEVKRDEEEDLGKEEQIDEQKMGYEPDLEQRIRDKQRALGY